MIFENFLRNWDEAWYAEIIRNMSEGSGLLVPYWNGQYYFDKPPLYFWLTLPVVNFFGPPAGGGEWQERMVSIVATIAATVLVFLIGKKLFGKTAGLLASLVFVTMGQVAVRFLHGNLDALLVCFFLLTFYLYLLSKNKAIPSVLTGISLGLGFLIKGWFVGLFPLLWIFSYSILSERKLPKNTGVILIFAILSSFWWYVLGILKFGGNFYEWYLLNPGGGLLGKPFESFSLSYFTDLIRDIGFWWVFILVAAIKLKKISSGEKSIIISSILPVTIFIFSLNFLSGKLGWYNLPTYPLIAISIGLLGSKLFGIFPRIISIALISIIMFLQIINVWRIENIYPDRSKVGADLGKHAREIVPAADTLILDDHDFTSFLYYSNHKMVYVLKKDGGKPGEWWILKHNDLENFLDNKEDVWIVTPNLDNLEKVIESGQTEDSYNGYWFLKF